MSCNKCSSYAFFKVIPLCRNDFRYDFLCEDCFVKEYSSICKYCNTDCRNAVIVKEFMWENAYDAVKNIKTLFPHPIISVAQTPENVIENNLHLPCGDDESENTIETEQSDEIVKFPFYSSKSKEYYQKMEVCLFVFKNEEKNYLNRSGSEWSLSRDVKQTFTIIIKTKTVEARIFLMNFYLDLSNDNILVKKYKNGTISSVPKFYMNGLKNDKSCSFEIDNMFLFFHNKRITLRERGEKKIYWIKI